MLPHKPLIDGQWQAYDNGHETVQSYAPSTGELLPEEYALSTFAELEAMIAAGQAVADELAATDPSTIADFLDLYALKLEANTDEICATAALETALPLDARLKSVEMPRTTDQLHQAAAAVRRGDWVNATIDSTNNIRSMFRPLNKPVLIFGPNNFPMAYHAIAGSDFACAIAARNPVIGKAHPSHLSTSRLLGEAAHAAVTEAGLPPATVQLFYHCSAEDGLRLAAHPGLGAVGFTGSRRAGLALKQAADSAGTPVYLEMSSVNPIFMLGGVLAERAADLAGRFANACTLGVGQFCTNPGLIIVPAGDTGEGFLAAAVSAFDAHETGTLLSRFGAAHIEQSIATLREAGASLVTGGTGQDYTYANTLLRVTGKQFLANPDALQTEAFGPVSVIIFADDIDEMVAIARSLSGNLTGSIYSSKQGTDDAAYDVIERALRPKVGRLLNDRMTNGVTVSPATVHGGPYPATGHPGFTAVGIPAAIHRFAALQCYDNVRPGRLPAELRDANPTGEMWRYVDGHWSQGNVGA